MNKSLLIVICDFLLLSMMALARFDRQPPEPPKAEPPVATMHESAAADIVDSLKLSLESEAEEREALAQQLADRARELESEQSRAETLEQEKSRLEGEQMRLQRLREQLEAERAKLEDSVRAEQEKLKSTQSAHQEQIAQTRQERDRMLAEVAAAQERQRLLQEQLAKREQALESAKEEMIALERQRVEAEREKAVLSTKLESAQVAQQRLEGEVSILRTEKDAAHQTTARLAENVGELAQAQQVTQDAIKEEIRQVTPLSLNTIYDNFRHNRGVLRFASREAALIGDADAAYEIYTVFVRDSNGRVMALAESSGTPLRVSKLAGLRRVRAEMDLPGALGRPVASVSFMKTDPRIIALPADEAAINAAGITPFIIEDAPFRFSNAVVVTADGEKYGEVPIRVSPASTRYIEVQNSISNRLFGSFSPSAGDLVFSQNGNLIGFMVSSGRAILMSQLATLSPLGLGDAYDATKAAEAARSLAPLIPAETGTRTAPSTSGGARR
ncbi:MAG: hypothetical protein JW942_01180 [Opitutales bacterium]|nr:hypothetical protein [Opitutales bacterium]